MAKARLLPLAGKYYGTEILVTLDDGREVGIDITSYDQKPSVRDEEEYGGHYEREATFLVASEIVRHFDAEEA